ncbi:MAG: sigma-54-dependent Fis family transcriptional regulator [Deltaproteobacteria bacterium]|nr:sigma-54-dependent Fis family transcriptional regulator [Deltaproteobacteria bacterium]
MASILIIDDDKGFCYTLTQVFKPLAHAVTCVHTLGDGLRETMSGAFDIVFLDVMLPDGNGIDMLPKIHAAPSRPEVIIVTSRGDPDGAELAVRNGAWDYIQKPCSIKEMMLPLLRATQYREQKMAKTSPAALKREDIIGNSLQMKACVDLLAQAAGSEAAVLIAGETGTGKESFALAIHNNSRRADRAFVVVDCAALPESLVESILFGHEKGAFTGADRNREGLIKQADGGTLFLDEVGELPLSVQKTFLRALQERRFRPLGGKREVESDFRLITATNRDLDEMEKGGRFRNDLLFRLRSFMIELPPLRERAGDIRELAMFQTGRLCERYRAGIKGFSPEFLEALMAYEWPGNVRELFQALERALAAAQHDPVLYPKHLPTRIRVKLARESLSVDFPAKGSVDGNAANSGGLPSLKTFRETLVARGEREYLAELMSRTQGDIREACRVSGLGQARLYGLLKKHGISRRGN